MSGSQNSENSKDSFVSDSRFNTLYPPFKRHKHWHDHDLYWATPSSKSAWGDTYARMSSGNGCSSPKVNQEHISDVGSVDSQMIEESQLPDDQYSPMYVCLFYYYSTSNHDIFLTAYTTPQTPPVSILRSFTESQLGKEMQRLQKEILP